MHNLLYDLGLISLTITIFYIIFWFDRRNKPTEYDLLRNHFQMMTHPNLIVRGHGKYYIEFTNHNKQFFDYFKTMNSYKQQLELLQRDNAIKIIKHGLSSNHAWENWGR